MSELNRFSKWFLSTLLTALPLFAAELGGSGPGGGDPQRIYARRAELAVLKEQSFKEKLLKEIFDRNEIKQRLVAMAKKLDLALIRDAQSQQVWTDLLEKGLLRDIEISSYVFKSECLDEKNISHALTTVKADPSQPQIGAEICINLKRLAEQTSVEIPDLLASTIGTFLHDHARHFGVDDNDHQFAMDMANAYYRFNAMARRGMDNKLFLNVYRAQMIGVRVSLEPGNFCPGKFGISLKHEVPYMDGEKEIKLGEIVYFDFNDIREKIFNFYPHVYLQVKHKADGFFSNWKFKPEESDCRADGVNLEVFDADGIQIYEAVPDKSDRGNLPSVNFNVGELKF